MNFFINRPIFAAAIALMMVLGGVISMLVLPVAQYPPLVPPQIQVVTKYTGASAAVVANTVTTPLEEQLNGSEGMIYMASNSTNNGDSVITATYEVGFDQALAQMDVLTRSNQALSQLPPEVKQVGLTINKQSSNIVLIVNLVSPKGTFDQRFLQNYADIHITDRLARIEGVASIKNFGLAKYAMRVWLDPQRLANMGMTAMDVENAIKEQNNQVAAGKLGAPPGPIANGAQSFVFQLQTQGRLENVSQFENIVIRAKADGTVVRLKDVARVELGAEDYTWSTSLGNEATAAIAIFQQANANSLQIAEQINAAMTELAKHFPEDVRWEIHYDTTRFIKESTREVVVTLLEAIALVVLVVFVFLQNLRSTLIPTIAIPVSLIGTFVVMLAFGFSINTLTLLGLVVAVALVVDDAIVVVENVNRHLEGGATDIRAVTEKAMDEVRGPIIATTLVLMAVFVPVSFIPGMTGQIYNQFALTIAIAVGLSGINSLSLSPALAAVLLRPQGDSVKNAFFRSFNRFFEALSNGYARSVETLSRMWLLVALVFAGLVALMVALFGSVPTAFVPPEDQGYVLVMSKLPAGATIERTKAVARQVNERVLATPGVSTLIGVPGYDLIDGIQDESASVAFVVLDGYDERKSKDKQLAAIVKHIQQQVADIPEARVVVANAPPIPGLGSTGGFNFEIQDLNSQGPAKLAEVLDNFIQATHQRPELGPVFSTFDAAAPMRSIEVDRVKAKTRGVALNDLFDTLQINLGSLYVNQFNKYGRVYRVYLQATAEARARTRDVLDLKVRNKDGDMIPLSALVSIKPVVGPFNISHYNEYGAAQLIGGPGPGYSGGQAVKAMEQVADEVLPEGFAWQWTNMVYQQKQAGNLAPVVFLMSLVFVFLVLAAQYESWSMPMMILLAIPLGLLGAVGLLALRGMSLDVYGQIGLVLLIGLVAKNSILIVQFAKDLHDGGMGIVEAAKEAARIRLRPILMTAFAFIFGLMPLVIASGAGAAARQSLGTAVVGGLTAATVLIVFVPVFYVVIERWRER